MSAIPTLNRSQFVERQRRESEQSARLAIRFVVLPPHQSRHSNSTVLRTRRFVELAGASRPKIATVSRSQWPSNRQLLPLSSCMNSSEILSGSGDKKPIRHYCRDQIDQEVRRASANKLALVSQQCSRRKLVNRSRCLEDMSQLASVSKIGGPIPEARAPLIDCCWSSSKGASQHVKTAGDQRTRSPLTRRPSDSSLMMVASIKSTNSLTRRQSVRGASASSVSDPASSTSSSSASSVCSSSLSLSAHDSGRLEAIVSSSCTRQRRRSLSSARIEAKQHNQACDGHRWPADSQIRWPALNERATSLRRRPHHRLAGKTASASNRPSSASLVLPSLVSGASDSLLPLDHLHPPPPPAHHHHHHLQQQKQEQQQHEQHHERSSQLRIHHLNLTGSPLAPASQPNNHARLSGSENRKHFDQTKGATRLAGRKLATKANDLAAGYKCVHTKSILLPSSLVGGQSLPLQTTAKPTLAASRFRQQQLVSTINVSERQFSSTSSCRLLVPFGVTSIKLLAGKTNTQATPAAAAKSAALLASTMPAPITKRRLALAAPSSPVLPVTTMNKQRQQQMPSQSLDGHVCQSKASCFEASHSPRPLELLTEPKGSDGPSSPLGSGFSFGPDGLAKLRDTKRDSQVPNELVSCLSFVSGRPICDANCELSNKDGPAHLVGGHSSSSTSEAAVDLNGNNTVARAADLGRQSLVGMLADGMVLLADKQEPDASDKGHDETPIARGCLAANVATNTTDNSSTELTLTLCGSLLNKSADQPAVSCYFADTTTITSATGTIRSIANEPQIDAAQQTAGNVSSDTALARQFGASTAINNNDDNDFTDKQKQQQQTTGDERWLLDLGSKQQRACKYEPATLTSTNSASSVVVIPFDVCAAAARDLSPRTETATVEKQRPEMLFHSIDNDQSCPSFGTQIEDAKGKLFHSTSPEMTLTSDITTTARRKSDQPQHFQVTDNAAKGKVQTADQQQQQVSMINPTKTATTIMPKNLQLTNSASQLKRTDSLESACEEQMLLGSPLVSPPPSSSSSDSDLDTFEGHIINNNLEQRLCHKDEHLSDNQLTTADKTKPANDISFHNHINQSTDTNVVLHSQTQTPIPTPSSTLQPTSNSQDVFFLMKTEPISDYYDLEARPFARGKFAQVKRCVHKKTKQCFAAKCIKRRRRLTDIAHEIMLEIEALKLGFQSDHIVKLFEVFETPNEVILVLEMAHGGELQRILDQEEQIEEQLVQIIIKQILDGLILLHDNNIAHLDIKPQNLLLSEPFPMGKIKLCDFGMSHRITDDCEIREIRGTPDYVAPEVLMYNPITLATDMWSLGILTYVLLSGYSPFGGENKQQTYCNITQGELDFPSEIFENVSNEAKDFMLKLIERDPRKRLTSRQARGHAWLCK